jgi:predicted kinase
MVTACPVSVTQHGRAAGLARQADMAFSICDYQLSIEQRRERLQQRTAFSAKDAKKEEAKIAVVKLIIDN